mmetsp:Transcript_27292/g.69430  ORF Transcript_27292/g.69430 Transcript_27292/m.69430 type:complete len:396 (-) Transcript_27292:180-1367(-)
MARSKRQPDHQRSGPRGAVQIVEGLYISGEDTAKNLERLRSLGVQSIVACGCPTHFPNEFRYLRIALQDNSQSRCGRFLDPAADFVADALRTGAVLVHCKAGICRSATIIMAYLLKYRHSIAHDVGAALAVVRSARPCVNPRAEFIAALDAFGKRHSYSQELVVPPQPGVTSQFPLGEDAPCQREKSGVVDECADERSKRRSETSGVVGGDGVRRGVQGPSPPRQHGAYIALAQCFPQQGEGEEDQRREELDEATMTTETSIWQGSLEGERAKLESQLVALQPLEVSVAALKSRVVALRSREEEEVRELREIKNVISIEEGPEAFVSEEAAAALSEAASLLAEARSTLKAMASPRQQRPAVGMGAPPPLHCVDPPVAGCYEPGTVDRGCAVLQAR